MFYPVLTREYAREIATQWNRHEAAAGFAGFVTAFDVADDFVRRYPIQQLGGGPIYRELWVLAGELAAFNDHLTGRITVAKAVYGPQFTGVIDPMTGLPTGFGVSGTAGRQGGPIPSQRRTRSLRGTCAVS